MVILKTPSQLNSFIKRMKRKHDDHHREGCGCCGHNITVERSGNRVILIDETTSWDHTRVSVTILAVIKGRAR